MDGNCGFNYATQVLEQPVRYQSDDEDSARWEGFSFRPGDIVISTRSKSGTTWMQMICALLIFQTPELPAPLAALSPWLDWVITPREQVVARLGAQTHRRFIKTHTPLDGLPLDQRVTYIVVGRHPLDLAVSRYHQAANIDRDRVRALSGISGPDVARDPMKPLHEWLVAWIDSADRRADRPPGWLFNVQASPAVEIQVGRKRAPASAQIVSAQDASYPRLWKLVNDRNHGRYDVYQLKTGRPIPLVVITPNA